MRVWWIDASCHFVTAYRSQVRRNDTKALVALQSLPAKKAYEIGDRNKYITRQATAREPKDQGAVQPCDHSGRALSYLA